MERPSLSQAFKDGFKKEAQWAQDPTDEAMRASIEERELTPGDYGSQALQTGAEQGVKGGLLGGGLAVGSTLVPGLRSVYNNMRSAGAAPSRATMGGYGALMYGVPGAVFGGLGAIGDLYGEKQKFDEYKDRLDQRHA